ncbi:MAG: single-stranded-DNA-specific exonuclease RecJ [Candidatus Omnitrophica bacterium]|nr:single-stranded-DNA-specific exonuclease RecJ [Candidatus Omnitrophota bacterium]
MDNKVWEFISQDEDLKSDLAGKLAISPFLAALLINRGIGNAREGETFLNPTFNNLSDPFDLPGMEAAAARVGEALKNKEPILVYGDYDADGVTATALLTLFLREAGMPVFTYIPHRIDEGYGLHFNPLREAKKNSGVGLVISVDCGIGAADVVAQAKEINLDLIITDHHLPSGQVPQGVPLVNPHLGREEKFKSLSGVGVAFELVRAVALSQKGNRPNFSEDQVGIDYLDLVATGTIADLSPLRGESRILTHQGLEILRRAPRPAFREIFRQAGIKPGRVDTQTVGWVLGPRINAAGRLSTADVALQLFLTESESERAASAEMLEQGNRKRQRLGQKALEAACREIEEQNLDERSIIIMGNEDWHPGVVGIVAGKIVDRYHRPAIIFGITPHLAKGSGRSIPGFHLFEAVQSCRALLISFGGHQKAVGVGVLPERLDEFRCAMEVLAEKSLKVEELEARIKIDAQIELSDLTPDLIREIETLAPYGQENPAPILASFGLEVQRYSRVVGKNHLKLWLKQGQVFRQAIYFGMAKLQPSLPAGFLVDVAYVPKMSGEDGINCVELEIKSLRESIGQTGG